mgnify:CR=1 FL=1
MSDDRDWIDELYAEGARETPPPELDAKIRATARQPVRHPWYRNPGRLAALATAASLVIAVSVIFFEPEQPQLETPAETPTLAEDNPMPPPQAPARSGERAERRFAAEPAQAATERAEPLLEEAMVADVADAAIGSLTVEKAAAAELTQRCGPLPGSEETREISSDPSGWLVTVTVGTDVRTWRCIDGAWIETTSEQQ